jgi:hypothetical protein
VALAALARKRSAAMPWGRGSGSAGRTRRSCTEEKQGRQRRREHEPTIEPGRDPWPKSRGLAGRVVVVATLAVVPAWVAVLVLSRKRMKKMKGGRRRPSLVTL